MNITVSIINSQRNGISGDPFYVAKVTDMDYPESDLLATFEQEQKEGSSCEAQWGINTTSCRVIDLNDLQNDWRGDRIGGTIAGIIDAELRKMNTKGLFTCMDGECNCKGKSATIYDLKGQGIFPKS